jgi:microsomal dipeptidase-like Zn-dependent dipeptidase
MTSCVIDLHNDLLSYLASSVDHTPFDLAPRCSVPQLRAGGVKGLCLTVFSETKDGCEDSLGRQVSEYYAILKQFPDVFKKCAESIQGDILIFPAIENTSAFIGERERLEDAFQRFERICKNDIRFVYASLTWNFENRCGGGTHSDKGLTEDGKRVIDFLGMYASAIDLSHACDKLCGDILRYLDESRSSLRVIASHANFREVTNVPRNLPDEIAQEIVNRGGVIGLAFIKSFIGPRSDYLLKHIEHALGKGWVDALCIGADFFVYSGLSVDQYELFVEEHFFPEYGDASRLSCFVDDVQKQFGEKVARGIASQNALDRLLIPARLYTQTR